AEGSVFVPWGWNQGLKGQKINPAIIGLSQDICEGEEIWSPTSPDRVDALELLISAGLGLPQAPQ
ncbi:MAG: hypothetical protein VX339_13765, partial [Pseudomonadota bacterium]|nr:hypothetical protein [Pseudomonadota bacterium]